MKLIPSLLPVDDGFDSDEKRYRWQVDVRANFILIEDDEPNIVVDVYKPSQKVIDTDLKWIKKGELIAGSFLCNIVNGVTLIEYSDIDIYFKSKDDIVKFLGMNPTLQIVDTIDTSMVAVRAEQGHNKYNLIFGIHYSTPKDLITRFDIRACSIAYNPNNNRVFCVRGALADCAKKRIIYNPIPHNTTVARLVKYIQKDFNIDAYQRLFLAELISSKQYNPDLELSTGYRAVK